MALIADILLIAGALGAAFYCVVLSRRLARFASLEEGMGGAITSLSSEVSEMSETLSRAQTAAEMSSDSLRETTERAEAAARRIELLLASLHDLPSGKTEAAEKEEETEAELKPVKDEVEDKPEPEDEPGTIDEADDAPTDAEPEEAQRPTFLRRRARKTKGAA